MPRRGTYQAIVLRSIDIGEADRFCILFTKERGRMAARGRGVRKLSSKMGGSLLPFRHLAIDVSESEHSATITSVQDKLDVPFAAASYRTFVRLGQGVELLLHLTQDDEPLPEVFDLLLQFIRLNVEEDVHPLLAFQLRLLHLLGFLPDSADDLRFSALTPDLQTFVIACGRIADLSMLSDFTPIDPNLSRFAQQLVDEQMEGKQLKSAQAV